MVLPLIKIPPIPIICFADDYIVLCKANDKSLTFIKINSQHLRMNPGLVSIWQKKKKKISKNINRSKQRDICDYLTTYARL